MKTLLVTLALLVVPSFVFAQADPCTAPVGSSDTLFTGARPTVTWTQNAADTVGGFFVTITGPLPTPKTDIGLPSPVTCPDGSKGYRYTLTVAPPKGSYVATVAAYNAAAPGGGPASTRPFDVVDPLPAVPSAPSRLKVSQ